MLKVLSAMNVIVYVPSTLFAVTALAFLALWRLGLSTSWQWSVGFAHTAAGFALSTFPVQPVFDALVSGMLFIGAAYFYGSALLAHFDAPMLRPLRRGFVAVYTLLLVYVVFDMQSLRVQLFLTDIGFACLFAIAWCAVVPRASRAADIALVVSSALMLIDTVARTVFFTFFTASSNDFADFVASDYNLAVHVTSITICMLVPFSAAGAMASAAVERQRDASERDPLTGLLNRRGFGNAVERFSRRSRDGALLICDIDHFKQINDSYGHAAGDRVLVELADEFRRVLGSDACTGRFGGEEFVAFLPGASTEKAVALAERVRQGLSAKDWRPMGIDRRITASFGVFAKNELPNLYEALDRADRALYAAKAAGRNRVMVGNSDATVNSAA